MATNTHPQDLDNVGRPAGRHIRITVLVLCALIFLAGYFFSTWLLSVYRGGDQEHYDRFWYIMQWADPSLWSQLQLQYLSSTDILYSVIVWFGIYLNADRIVYMSIWNGLLVSFLGWALIKSKASPLFAIFVFTNFYIFVLLGPAERLKFAYLLLILAFCVESMKFKMVFSLASPFAHSQAVAQFISSAVYYVSAERRMIFANRARAIAIIIAAPIAIGLTAYYLYLSLGDVFVQKSEYYGGESQGVLEIIQWGLILVCGVIVFQNRVPFVLAMLPLGVLTSSYGSRINVATLFFFCALALTQRKTAHPLVLAVMAYMSFKSIGFIQNVLETGQGF